MFMNMREKVIEANKVTELHKRMQHTVYFEEQKY